jgi:hypothetical protein
MTAGCKPIGSFGDFKESLAGLKQRVALGCGVRAVHEGYRLFRGNSTAISCLFAATSGKVTLQETLGLKRECGKRAGGHD